MKLVGNELDATQRYKLLTGIIVPRPIAWVSTVNNNGGVNLAPFSNFTFLGTRALRLGFGVVRKPNGDMKDTEANIRRTKDFVINIGSVRHLDPLHQSSIDHPDTVSEADLLGLTTIASDTISSPRLTDVDVSLECELTDIINFGDEDYYLMVGTVKMFHVADHLIDTHQRIDTQKLDPLMRVGGPHYAKVGELFECTYLTNGYKEK